MISKELAIHIIEIDALINQKIIEIELTKDRSELDQKLSQMEDLKRLKLTVYKNEIKNKKSWIISQR